MNEEKNVNEKVSYKKNVLISLVFFVVLVAINYLSAMGFIAGNSQSDVSRNFPTMITPAGFAFSIWGIIYLFIFISIISPLFKKSEANIEKLNTIAPLFWLSAIINMAWTFAFSSQIIWFSAILIIALLINVFMIMKKLKMIGGDNNGFFDIGFGLYAGWLSIASVVNFMAFLVSIKFEFFNNPKLFYSIILVIFVLVVATLQKFHNNPFYPLAIVWAFFGIIKKLIFESFADSMFLILLLGMVVLLVIDFLFSARKMKFSF